MTIIDRLSMTKRWAILIELFNYPFPIFIKKVRKAILNRLFPPAAESFGEHRLNPTPLILEQYLSLTRIEIEQLDNRVASLLLQNYKEHRFDLLGSGPVSVNYLSPILGIEQVYYPLEEDTKNIIQSGHLELLVPENFKEVTKQLIAQLPAYYNKIDWHRDYKSGFRFDSRKAFGQSFSELKPGVDLKCPWELTRLQHLPTMALLAQKFPEEKEKLILEFKHQLIDHIAMNPMGIGVNWACAMDVGIRIANILVAYDLFRSIDENGILDDYFHQLVSNYAYYHGVFLYQHLEYGEGITSNHYLSNIAGLIYIASYLEPTPEVLDWLYFSIQELEVETGKQFFSEGSNFEGSTSYHRLSTEIILYCAAIVEGISMDRKKALYSHQPAPRKEDPAILPVVFKQQTSKILSDNFYTLLYHATQFTHDILKPNGEIPQYGDNDSGRFIKLFPTGKIYTTADAHALYQQLDGLAKAYPHAMYFDENILDHSSLLSAASALFNDPLLKHFGKNAPVEHACIKMLSNNFVSQIQTLQEAILFKPKEIPGLEYRKSKTFILPNEEGNFLENLKAHTYPAFGITVFKSDYIYLSIGYGANRKSHRSWGHQHNDKLSIELMIDGKDILVNNGTYLYTPFPNLRNKFRSTFYKNLAFVPGQEQNWWKEGKPGLFNLIKQSHTEILTLTNQEITLLHQYRDIVQVRQILIRPKEVEIIDSCNKPFEQFWNQKEMYSNGYGKLYRQQV